MRRPALISLIVFLHMRGRMSRPRIREFLMIWTGPEPGTDTINQCIHEAGRAAAPVEDQLIAEVLSSDLLNADETTWLIAGKPFWLWVFVTSTVCLYYITHRTNELVQNLLTGFSGWLMTDGYQAREGPPDQNLPETVAELLNEFKRECERMRDNPCHEKARQLAVAFLNDWDTIFMPCKAKFHRLFRL